MASSTASSSDLVPYPAAATPTMDDLLHSIYPPLPMQQPPPPRTAEEVWRDISVDRKVVEEMTLEDFLAKEGVVREEDVRVSPPQFAGMAPGGGYLPVLPPPQQHLQQQLVPGGVETVVGMARGKRRAALLEPPAVDRVAQQRQRRMIKNRESAARSRERKQAYTVELESLVTRLEDENAQLSKQMEAEAKARLRKLMENVIPVTEMRRPPRRLRRTFSMSW